MTCSGNGQCNCKTFVSGDQCHSCDEGYYGLVEKNMFGCTGIR